MNIMLLSQLCIFNQKNFDIGEIIWMFRNGYDYLTYIFWKIGRANFTIWYFELEILVQVGIEAQGLIENYSIGRIKCYMPAVWIRSRIAFID